MAKKKRSRCSATVVGREPCRYPARANRRFCVYHDPPRRASDVDITRWCSWSSSTDTMRCQRWALRTSDRCSQHDPERSAESLISERVQRNARIEGLSNLAEHNDAERQKAIPDVVAVVRALADTTIFDARRNDALEKFGDALAAVSAMGPVASDADEALQRSLIQRYDEAVMRLIALELHDLPGTGPLCEAWVKSKKLVGDWEALRWAWQGLEKDVERPHTDLDLCVTDAIRQSIARQPANKVRWSAIQRDVETATGHQFGSLENFNKWVVRHLGDLIAELPPRATQRKGRTR